MQRSAKGYLRPYNRGDVHDKGRDLCDTQDRGRGRGRRGRGRGRRGRGSQGGRPSSSPSIIIGPNGRRETNHGFRFIEISENTTLDPFRAANSGDLLP
ncbi:hypothetical protein L249_4863 [Ophiocordyceps polyrhachis-furcata BCC 54312]|uniref:Uncharacterized protein n=1 Tax=Ophiocordyceps polyrhachis-furcata BCC 54312 TaxID=1330021 RepID=A0A367L324_9HYPO|nr:hypothetical protein L249_4863 [Ophiocordyceps polyrhachis-furcata BCC 54312]